MFSSREFSGTGLIKVDDASKDLNMHLDVDRETKKLIVTYMNHKYAYDIDGWLGRYGKPLEFLLTLHLATMAPKFAEEVALNWDLDTKVYLRFYPVNTSIKLLYLDETGTKSGTAYEMNGNRYIEVTESNYSELGFSDGDWEDINKYNDDDIQTLTPYISKVTNHWFRNLEFPEDCYEIVENDGTNRDQFTRIYEYVGMGEDDDSLKDRNLYVLEERKSDIFQVAKPKILEVADGKVDSTKLMKEMLLGGDPDKGEENTNEDYKYSIYDGKPLANPTDTREKRYIIQKTGIDINGKSITKMDTRMFQYAFAILENVNTQDAQYILRDLKELLRDLGVKIDEIENRDDTRSMELKHLEWILPDYLPVVWDPSFNSNETVMIIQSKENYTRGFEADTDVIMPVRGKIVKIVDEKKFDNEGNEVEVPEEEKTQTVIIEIEDNGDKKDLNGITITFAGIKLDSSISEGSVLSAKDKLGKTVKGKNIAVIMADKDKTPIKNVDDYIYPPEDNPIREE